MQQVDIKSQIQKYAEQIVRELNSWEYYRLVGGQDPFYSDGENMNLIRQHIISYKNDIRDLCAKHNEPFPEEYYLATPSEVDKNYLAKNGKYFQTRKKNIEAYGDQISTKMPAAVDTKLQEIF